MGNHGNPLKRKKPSGDGALYGERAGPPYDLALLVVVDHVHGEDPYGGHDDLEERDVTQSDFDLVVGVDLPIGCGAGGCGRE